MILTRKANIFCLEWSTDKLQWSAILSVGSRDQVWDCSFDINTETVSLLDQVWDFIHMSINLQTWPGTMERVKTKSETSGCVIQVLNKHPWKSNVIFQTKIAFKMENLSQYTFRNHQIIRI